MKTVKCLTTYFESEPNGRKLTMPELKALSKEERRELAEMAAVELGIELEVSEAA